MFRPKSKLLNIAANFQRESKQWFHCSGGSEGGEQAAEQVSLPSQFGHISNIIILMARYRDVYPYDHSRVPLVEVDLWIA